LFHLANVALLPMLKDLGLSVIEIPTHPTSGLALDALELLLSEKRLNAIVAMPTVHNPLGSTMPPEAKRRLAQLVNDY
ncbi:aminotransferase class I/II-fold pyridoxal phosphate-dependent enzyme, partial [Klebsiella pneumoniae]|nr:aminotransferase class I/II-fold pyridoxal phosphate-dependent enzyme [Klebsiella pneumoniae]